MHILAKFQTIISMYSVLWIMLWLSEVCWLFFSIILIIFKCNLIKFMLFKNEVCVIFVIRFLLLNITVKKSLTVIILSWPQTLNYLSLCVSQQHVCWQAGVRVCVRAREGETEIFQETYSSRCDLGIMYWFSRFIFSKKCTTFCFPHLFKSSFDLCLFSVWGFIGLVKSCRVDTTSVPWVIN